MNPTTPAAEPQKKWFHIWDADTLAFICDMRLETQADGETPLDAYDPRIGGSGNVILQLAPDDELLPARIRAAYPLLFAEFPDYDPLTLPAIPAGFEDSSWHNDAAPSFEDPARGLRLWIDYADPALREIPAPGRFILCHPEQGHDDILVSDDFAEILAKIAELDTARVSA